MNDPLRAWAIEAWKKEVLRNLPAAKLARQLKAQDRLLKREYLKEKRSLASHHSERMRLLKRQQAESEAALREKREALDRELEQKRWEILTGYR